MSLKIRMLVLSSIMALVLIIQGAVLFNSNITILGNAETISSQQIPALNYAHQLKLSVVQVQQWLTDISATRALDGLNDGFDEAENNAKLFRDIVSKLKSIDSSHEQELNAMTAAFEDYYRVGQQMAQAYIDDGPAGGNKTMAAFDAAAESLNSRLDPFLESAQASADEATKSQNTAIQNSKYIVAISFILLISFLIFMTTSVVKAIVAIPRIVAQMAQKSITHNFEISGTDEISEIMNSMQTMRDKLRDMVTGISASTTDLSETSDELKQLFSTTQTNLELQFSEIDQVATAMNEMTVSSHQIADTVLVTTDSAKEANAATSNGQNVVGEALIEISSLSDQIENAARTIAQVEKDSDEIAGVLEVIKSIADQTNLLALNAAIEAARAGEQGRGFAVVADEVRNLASRTQQSTGEINEMIERLLQGSRSAVDLMTKSRTQAENALGKAQNTGDAFTEISSAVERIYDMSNQIASASEEQSKVAEEINQSIVRINDMSNSSVENIETASNSSGTLAQMASKLKSNVELFVH